MPARRLAVPLLVVLAALGPVVAADTCVPLCGSAGMADGVVPPVLVVVSGARLTWTGLDGELHTATEARAERGADRCLHVFYGLGRVGAATLTIRDGALEGATPKGDVACTGATPLPDGGFVLQIECLFHKNMDQVLLVRPA